MITLKVGNNPPNGPNDAIDDRRMDEAGHPTMRKAHLKRGRGPLVQLSLKSSSFSLLSPHMIGSRLTEKNNKIIFFKFQVYFN